MVEYLRRAIVALAGCLSLLALWHWSTKYYPLIGPTVMRYTLVPKNENLMEKLARESNNDKQWGMHKYTDAYNSLFEDRRLSTVNFTEVGVLYGASVSMWAAYFPNANIYGFDPFTISSHEAARNKEVRELC